MPEPLTQKNLVSQIKFELDRFNIPLKINPSFATSQASIINLCDMYFMSKYRDGDTDSLGQHKAFYNISVLPVEVASKTLDIDTKNIRLLGEDSGSYWISWIKGKELNYWMKDKYFGRQLNLYPFYWAKYGHLFLKKVRDEVMVVNPRQIVVRANAENLDETPILEFHEMERDAFYAMAKNNGWENYKLTAQEEKSGNKVLFYEMFFPKGFWDSSYNYFIVRPGAEKIMVYLNLEVCPYKALPWERVPGRFLGRGQVEKLFEDQIYLNRLANYKAEGLNWTSKHIYQTRDPNFNANLLVGTDNGDVLSVKSELTPVATEERNLGFYSYEETRWENMAFKKAFTTEPITGDRSPSGTPLGSTMLQAQMTTGYYDQKKEELGSFIEEVLWDWVLPEFEKQNNAEHDILIQNLVSSSDDYSNKFFQLVLSQKMNKKQIEFMQKGRYLSSEQYQIIKGIQSDLLKQEPLKIERGAYKNLKEKIQIDIVGEHIDSPAKIQSLWSLITLLGQNPAIMRDPAIKKPIMKALDLSGFNPHDFDFEDDSSTVSSIEQVAAQRGGSLAKQVPNQLPTSTPQLAYAS
jgi:hypothetical protein